MLLESVADAKDQGARPQREWRLRVRVRQRAKAAIESGKPCVRSGAISFRQGRERRVELRAEAESRCNPPKIDDRVPNRQRGYDLRPLQRIGRIRQCRDTAVHAAFPILSRPPGRVRRETPQTAQRQREQTARPKGGRERRQQAKRQRSRAGPCNNRLVKRTIACCSSVGILLQFRSIGC